MATITLDLIDQHGEIMRLILAKTGGLSMIDDKPNPNDNPNNPNTDNPPNDDNGDKPNGDKDNPNTNEGDNPNEEKPNNEKPTDNPNEEKPNPNTDNPNDNKPNDVNPWCNLALGNTEYVIAYKVNKLKYPHDTFLTLDGAIEALKKTLDDSYNNDPYFNGHYEHIFVGMQEPNSSNRTIQQIEQQLRESIESGKKPDFAMYENCFYAGYDFNIIQAKGESEYHKFSENRGNSGMIFIDMVDTRQMCEDTKAK